MKKAINSTTGLNDFTMTIFAFDKGTPSLSGYTHVNVIYTPAPPVTTLPTPAEVPCFFCTVPGILLFSFLMAVAAGLILFGVFALLRYIIWPNLCRINFRGLGRMCRFVL